MWIPPDTALILGKGTIEHQSPIGKIRAVLWIRSSMLAAFGGKGERQGNRLKLWKSGFDYTDIVKCDGEFFLKSSSRGFMFLYQISSDNPQKDNFHNLILMLTKDSYFVLLTQLP